MITVDKAEQVFPAKEIDDRLNRIEETMLSMQMDFSALAKIVVPELYEKAMELSREWAKEAE
jgi:hypothetical protein